MKKGICFLLALLLTLLLTACGVPPEVPPEGTIRVGVICIGDENDQGYTFNFMNGTRAAAAVLAAEGIAVEFITKFNVGSDSSCEYACVELAEEGCQIVICSSYGHENYMLKAAPMYPEVAFISCTNQNSARSPLENVHNVFADIYEARYLAGIAAGMKLNELIQDGRISKADAMMGYVASFSYPEVISGFTAFFLGARSVCPSVTLEVQYTGSWMDPAGESNAAQALIDTGAILLSQHSDSATVAAVAQQNGVFHCGYSSDMTAIAPEGSLLSCRIDWSVYLTETIRNAASGRDIPKDWTAGMAEGAVVLTPLNEAIAAPGTAEAIAEAEALLRAGELAVFAGPLRGTGMADGAHEPDTLDLPVGAVFQESDVAGGKTSAPYFYWILDGITERGGRR